jgi:hypothetical protein
MRRGWKRVAESADNDAFGTDEIRDAILPSLEKRTDVRNSEAS